jgi:hypothetical protein
MYQENGILDAKLQSSDDGVLAQRAADFSGDHCRIQLQFVVTRRCSEPGVNLVTRFDRAGFGLP